MPYVLLQHTVASYEEFKPIYDAVGIRLVDMPATPEKILWALQQKAEAEQAPTAR